MNERTATDDQPTVEDQLERWVDRALAGVAAQAAPSTLEARVLGEIRRRAAQPWWRHSFAHWPVAARAAFVALSGGLIVLVFQVGTWTGAAVHSIGASGVLSLYPAQQTMALTSVTMQLAALLERAVPPMWLYAALAAGAALYATLFGLGAAAYRTLYHTPLNGR